MITWPTLAASTMRVVASARILAAASSFFCMSESGWTSACVLMAFTNWDVACKVKQSLNNDILCYILLKHRCWLQYGKSMIEDYHAGFLSNYQIYMVLLHYTRNLKVHWYLMIYLKQKSIKWINFNLILNQILKTIFF